MGRKTPPSLIYVLICYSSLTPASPSQVIACQLPSVAMTKYHDGKQLKEEFLLAFGLRGDKECMMVGKAWHGHRSRSWLTTFYPHTRKKGVRL